MKVSLIAAMDKNRVIGKENDIPWRIPKDWEYVKNTTKGHPIILGRKNLESIGRALPDRRNIILTRDKGFTFNGC
ncbi:TPA: dihydrofolate reductase, partial [Enterococcus faecium]|nr:dihydrofolate reductase [Enterococcus faecium]